MTMKKIIIAAMLISTLPIFGQNHFVGVISGINGTSVNSDYTFNNSTKRFGFKGGLTYQYLINDKFSLDIELLYEQRGFKNDISFINPSGDPIGPKENSEFYYDYLSFPIKAGYSIGNTFSGFVNLGIVPAYIVKAEIAVPTFGGSETFDNIDRATSFDFGGLIEAGAAYAIMDRLIITASFAYQHSITTFSNPDYFSDSNMRHYGMSLSVGIKYALKKKGDL